MVVCLPKGSIPDYVKEDVLNKKDVCQKMLTNPAYETLPKMATMLDSMRKFGKALAKDGLGLGNVIDHDILSSSGDRIPVIRG